LEKLASVLKLLLANILLVVRYRGGIKKKDPWRVFSV